MFSIRNVFRKVAPPILKRKYREWRFDVSQVIYNQLTYKDSLDIGIKSLDYSIDDIKKELLKDVRNEFLDNHFRPDEYFLYDFWHKSKKERKQYLSQKEKNRILYDFYSPEGDRIVWQLQDKYTFYTLATPFFKRQVIKVQDRNDWNQFSDFCHKHPNMICKVINKGCGVGIWKASVNSEKQAKDLFQKLTDSGEYVVEELIIQDEAMASFNDSSVNTVRYPSYRHGDKTIGAYPCIRFGRKGSVVDNAGQGGIFASIDIATGKISTCGYDEKGNMYDVHPDSGLVIKDFQIPKWEELVVEARNAHLSLPPDHTYVAFDYALTEKGWILIEGNWGDFVVQQITLKRGLKYEFVSLLKGQ